ncbi:MAG TPA: rhodanese-like domain-containing protein [Thermoanaerobaculia bacterium]|nr:rhodanese-like domain-containing protein [Thermoanaerobaculia bacterium]
MISHAVLGLALSLVTTPGELASRPAGTVTILDARPASDYRRGHVPGAVRIDWTDFRDGWGRTGKLPRDLDGLARRLAGFGVDSNRAAVVYGNARTGWGEEGRIVWMLAYLGHPQARLLDGGWEAWREARLPISTADERPLAGRFRAAPVAALRASAADVDQALHAGSIVLDVRSDEEWHGATPYFEARGGHIPGAVHVEWKALLDPLGRIDPVAARARLLAAGIKPGDRVITYCTGGVRSAEAWVILRALGYADVRNYDGSWYEWSADDRRPVARR